jgi:hypothetical protein
VLPTGITALNTPMKVPTVLPHPDPHPLGEGAVSERPAGCNPARCPLCGGVNDCQLCTTGAYKGPCWCEKVAIPDELLARVPVEQRNRACICRACVAAFHAERSSTGSARLTTEDFYLDTSGLMVFTEAYHLRRGTCCDSGCRHCPFERAT